MWVLKNGGDFAVNEESGAILKTALCKDGLVRVKRNYKTIATFETVTDAKNYIAELVEKLNKE